MNGKRGWILVAGGLACAAVVLPGCSELILFYPKGPIGESERYVILAAFALMLLVVIPVIVMSVWFPLKYRAANKKAAYTPNWSHSGRIELVMWCIPLAIVLALSVLLWRETHRLDPYRPIAAAAKPLEIEVVSLDWKWLFIYPQANIAVVNELVFPARVPLSFRLTSDTVMTSFFIPQLGSQIYAMAGMQTRLHLLADTPGTYTGQNQQFSGAGFSAMHFPAIATSPEQYAAWLEKARQSPDRLDQARFAALRQPGVSPGPQYFSSVEPGLFEHILGTYKATPASPAPASATAGMGHPGHGN